MTTWIRKPAEYDHTKSLQENRWRDRGAVRCCCGATVDLAYGSDTDCEQCGQLFNACGQMLQPECLWEEPYDED